MNRYSSYEERYTSAYCRLSYDVWYQSYKDDVTKHMEKQGDNNPKQLMYVAKKELGNPKVIKVDGVLYKETIELKTWIEAIICFLAENDDLEVALALPYEEHKEADILAYKYVNELIEIYRFDDELRTDISEYVLKMSYWNRKSEGYIKVFSDGTVKHAIYTYDSKMITRGEFQMESILYEEIVKWCVDRIQGLRRKWKKEMHIWMEGMSYERVPKLYLEYNLDKLGLLEADGGFDDSGLFEIKGHGAMTKLLRMPELAVFVESVENGYKYFNYR